MSKSESRFPRIAVEIYEGHDLDKAAQIFILPAMPAQDAIDTVTAKLQSTDNAETFEDTRIYRTRVI